MNTYTYTVGTVLLDKLTDEIKAAVPGKTIPGLSKSGNQLSVFAMSALTTDEQSAVVNALAAHSPVDMTRIIKEKYLVAVAFGSDLMADYATKRIMRGCGVADTERVLAKLATIQRSILSGSLYVAIEQLEAFRDQLLPDPDIPDSDCNEFITKIKAFLGI